MTSNNTKKANSNDSKQQQQQSDNGNNRIRSSTKRPRAPIACFRCHHKKVRCDGVHPNCTRCLTTGVLCAYPSSRRSRTTQPTNVDPFIDNLSHLEARIRRIETDLENQRSMVHSIVSSPTTFENNETTNELSSKMLKTEIEVQDSRSILAQLRLRGEQRISRGKRAAAAAAAANNAPSSTMSLNTKEEKVKNRQSNTKLSNNNETVNTKANNNNSNKLKQHQLLNSSSKSSSNSSNKTVTPTTTNKKQTYQQPFYFQGMMLDNNTDMNSYDNPPPGHGMDWTLFEQGQGQQSNEFINSTNGESIQNMGNLFSTSSTAAPISTSSHLMFPDNKSMMMDTSPVSTRSSSLASNLGFPVILQPSNSTTSTTSNATALSSTTSCSSLNSCENIFGFAMEGMMLHSSTNESSQDVHMLSNNPSIWYYHS